MPKAKKSVTKTKGASQSQAVQNRKVNKPEEGFFDKVQQDFQKNQSYLNLILGSLIVIVLGILLFNYFNKPQGNVGTSDSTENQLSGDISKDKLPGNYTVKEGDTLFIIAQKYYDNGNEYPKILEANKLSDPNLVTVGQVLVIPKLAESSSPPTTISLASPSPAAENPSPSPSPQAMQTDNTQATGGAENETIWGEKITGNTYTVTQGDWLSKIAGRAYGDIFQYDKIAKANNIQNPDLIEPGTVLKIPR